jgi:hypothetical protein
VGVAGNVRGAESDVDRIRSDGRGIHREVGLLVNPLVYAKIEVVPP